MDACKYYPFKKLIEKLKQPPPQPSNKKLKPDYEKLYKLTEKQVIEGNTDHLYDEYTYDPLFP